MNKINVIILVCFSTFIQCSTRVNSRDDGLKLNPSYINNGGYKWQFFKADEEIGDSTIFAIKLYNNDGTPFDNSATIEYNCKKFIVKNGKAYYKSKNSEIESQLRVVSIGYFSIATKPYLFKSNDSIIIDFIMAEDDRPFINCEGFYQN